MPTFTSTTTLVTSMITPETWHSILTHPDGRDKLLRLIQYVCKLLRWLEDSKYGGASNNDTTTTKFATRASSLEGALAISRQAGRLFKWSSMYVKGRRHVNTMSMSRKEDILGAISDAAMLMYYITDNTAFVAKLGVVNADAKHLSKKGARLWLLAIVAGTLTSAFRITELSKRAYALRKASDRRNLLLSKRCAHSEDMHVNGTDMTSINGKRESEEEEEEEERNIDQEEDEGLERVAGEISEVYVLRKAKLATIIKQVCDIGVACNGAFDTGMHQSVVGLCGTISSAIGLQQIWPQSEHVLED